MELLRKNSTDLCLASVLILFWHLWGCMIDRMSIKIFGIQKWELLLVRNATPPARDPPFSKSSPPHDSVCSSPQHLIISINKHPSYWNALWTNDYETRAWKSADSGSPWPYSPLRKVYDFHENVNITRLFLGKVAHFYNSSILEAEAGVTVVSSRS